jgi:hypothetical protein
VVSPIAWAVFDNVSLRPGKEKVVTTAIQAGRVAVRPGEAAMEKAARAFIDAVQKNDAEAAKRLAVGSVEGWKKWEARRPGEPATEGLYEIALRVVIGEVRESYAEDMSRLADLRHVAASGDYGMAAFAPPRGGEKPLVLVMRKTPKGWRMLDMKRVHLKDVALSQRVEINGETYGTYSAFVTTTKTTTTQPAKKP